jgi:triosephosphate isomerase
MRRSIIAGNWKMNGTLGETEALLSELVKVEFNTTTTDVVVCPPYPCLQAAHKILQNSQIALGAQEMSAHEKGAYTGEVSAAILLTVGVSHVILGHSERRQYHAESNSGVNAKARAALNAGLTPIICIGESLEEREADKTEDIIGTQIDGVLDRFTADMIVKSVVAYEPVWAIGTGKTATPEMAQAVHKFIRARVAKLDSEAAQTLPILYGGSVKPDNAAGLLCQPDIDGALVGGASLKATDFSAIIKAVK